MQSDVEDIKMKEIKNVLEGKNTTREGRSNTCPVSGSGV
jgi:hypothetical protein